ALPLSRGFSIRRTHQDLQDISLLKILGVQRVARRAGDLPVNAKPLVSEGDGIAVRILRNDLDLELLASVQRHWLQMNFDDVWSEIAHRDGVSPENWAVHLAVVRDKLGRDPVAFLRRLGLECRSSRSRGPVDKPLVPVGDPVAVHILSLDFDAELRVESHVNRVDFGGDDGGRMVASWAGRGSQR